MEQTGSRSAGKDESHVSKVAEVCLPSSAQACHHFVPLAN